MLKNLAGKNCVSQIFVCLKVKIGVGLGGREKERERESGV